MKKDFGKFKKSAYNQIRADLNTFDIVLWSGTGNLSKFIQMGTQSLWSHVGMVLRTEPDLVMLWESTLEEDHSGVQLTPLSKSVYGSVAVRRMNIPGGITTEMNAGLARARLDFADRKFEASWMEFMKAGWDGPFGKNTKDLTTLFCAELIAETLMMCGLLEDETVSGKPSNEYTPKDFSTEETDPKAVPLLKGATLEDEVMIYRDQAAVKSLSIKKMSVNTRGMVP